MNIKTGRDLLASDDDYLYLLRLFDMANAKDYEKRIHLRYLKCDKIRLYI
jgi:hypothetical protein